jgi:resuscitation-promoting factor RpfB
VSLTSAETIPANLLLEAEMTLFPQDRVWVNGEVVDPNESLEHEGSTLLQYQPATPIRLTMGGEDERTIYTGEDTLGAALATAGIQVKPEDWISIPLSTVITEPMAVTIRQARTVIVTLGDESVTGLTAADTVGEALLDLGMPLQNLNYSIPAEDQAVPKDGVITVVPVREDIQVVTEEITHQVEYQEDPNTPLDQTAVVQEGQNTIFATRERVRHENGEEVWRASEEAWQASQQKTEIVGYGSKVEVQTEVVEGETLEYYRKISVWTTTYRPCVPGTDICHYGTSSGLPVEKGVIAVAYDWYLLLQGQRVYVSGYGYGVIADVCGGCVGKPWLDLGYSEENYDALHIPNAWRTVYFLTPVPDYVPALLP